MATFVMFRTKVQDFAKWKPVYDADLAARDDAGLEEMHLLQNAADPNDVILLFEAADLDRAKAFSESPELRDKMQESGVTGRPDIVFLTD